MQESTRKNHKKLYVWIVVTVIAISAFLGIGFLMLIYHVPQYVYNYVECGFKPPVKGFKDPNSSSGGRYTLPSDGSYLQTNYLYGAKYYCSEGDAISDGAEHFN